MAIGSSDKLQDYIDRCCAEAEVEIEELADELGDTIHGYIPSDEMGLASFRKWSSVGNKEYFLSLVRKYMIDFVFTVIMSAAFVAATLFETNPPVKHTAQFFFAVMVLSFVTIVCMEIRMQFNFFKRNGYPLKEMWDIRDYAVRMIGIGDKFIYSTFSKPSTLRTSAPELVVNYEPHNELVNLDVVDYSDKKVLIIAGNKIGLHTIDDPNIIGLEEIIADIRTSVKRWNGSAEQVPVVGQ